MMNKQTDPIDLVRQAQQGHPEARRELVQVVEPRLAEYVGRMILDRDLTTDIVQDTIAEMLKILGNLKDPERFWCWLYAITLNKVRAHYRQRCRHKGTSLSQIGEDCLQAGQQGVLAELVTEELKQIVVRAVDEMEPRQRAVLIMRCYDQMSYSQISQVMRCSQLGVRALFFRAKKTLARLLNSHGIDKTALPVALLFFGKLTARSQASAAAVSITTSTLQVGPWAAMAAQPVLLAALLVAAMAGAAGIFAAQSGDWGSAPRPTVSVEAPPVSAVSQDASCWYYYPPGRTGTVMIRNQGQGIAYSQWLQKQQANYYRQGDTIYIRNHRQFASDLSVWRLPTDPPPMRRFLQDQDRRDLGLKYVAPSSHGLLVAVEQSQADGRRQATLSYDVSMEDYFRHDWARGATVVDQRDELHHQGWTWFTVTGRIGTKTVSGYGRVPFVASAVQDHGPWLKLAVGDERAILDAGTAAEMRGGSGMVLARYAGGSFFQGLGRPWCGLHTIDTIRRDAALAGIAFVTRPLPDGQRVEITLDGPQAQMTYRVHLYQDWIETITFSTEGAVIGDWTFSYPRPDEADPHRLTVPSLPPGGQGQTSVPSGLWLMRLAQGSLVQ
jgi:RNA polymerase sigma-70 factor (ECF subfamily)